MELSGLIGFGCLANGRQDSAGTYSAYLPLELSSTHRVTPKDAVPMFGYISGVAPSLGRRVLVEFCLSLFRDAYGIMALEAIYKTLGVRSELKMLGLAFSAKVQGLCLLSLKVHMYVYIQIIMYIYIYRYISKLAHVDSC